MIPETDGGDCPTVTCGGPGEQYQDVPFGRRPRPRSAAGASTPGPVPEQGSVAVTAGVPLAFDGADPATELQAWLDEGGQGPDPAASRRRGRLRAPPTPCSGCRTSRWRRRSAPPAGPSSGMTILPIWPSGEDRSTRSTAAGWSASPPARSPRWPAARGDPVQRRVLRVDRGVRRRAARHRGRAGHRLHRASPRWATSPTARATRSTSPRGAAEPSHRSGCRCPYRLEVLGRPIVVGARPPPPEPPIGPRSRAPQVPPGTMTSGQTGVFSPVASPDAAADVLVMSTPTSEYAGGGE